MWCLKLPPRWTRMGSHFGSKFSADPRRAGASTVHLAPAAPSPALRCGSRRLRRSRRETPAHRCRPYEKATTGADGNFTASLPLGVTLARAVVMAAGHPIQTFVFDPNEGPIQLHLEDSAAVSSCRFRQPFPRTIRYDFTRFSFTKGWRYRSTSWCNGPGTKGRFRVRTA